MLVLSAAPTRSDLEGQQRPYPCRGRLSIEAPPDRRALPGESEARARGASAGAFHQQIHPKGRTPRQTQRARARPHGSKTERGSCIGRTKKLLTDRVCTCHQSTMVLARQPAGFGFGFGFGVQYGTILMVDLTSTRPALRSSARVDEIEMPFDVLSAQCYVFLFSGPSSLVLSSFFPGGRALLARARRCWGQGSADARPGRSRRMRGIQTWNPLGFRLLGMKDVVRSSWREADSAREREVRAPRPPPRAGGPPQRRGS